MAFNPGLEFYFDPGTVHFWHREDTLPVEQEKNGGENFMLHQGVAGKNS
jgi:hypothetical protein